MNAIDGLVELIKCDTAKEFIAALRITDNRWLQSNARQSQWLFRGQVDADFPLISSAWRTTPPGDNNTRAQKLKHTFLARLKDPIKQAILMERSGYVPSKRDAEEFEEIARQNPNLEVVLRQAIFEIEAVRSFADFVDRLGLQVPQGRINKWGMASAFDWQVAISNAVKMLKETEWKGSPNRQIWGFKDEPIVALARHHGMPASLLDWTRKPLIAAFFAADDVSKYLNPPNFLAVWAIHTSLIGRRGQRLQQPRLFRSDLGYLHAQDGVLTFDVAADHFFINKGSWPTILDAVEATPHSLEHTPMRKIILPTNEAKEVLRLLWAEGISRPHLMPTFDNITATLEQNWSEDLSI